MLIVLRGKYLVENVSGCVDCHTPQNRGQPIAGMQFGGGQVFDGPWGEAVSANLTPDASGIPHYDEALFVQTMRTGYVKARGLNQIMPWHVYRGMTDEDLKAMFAYLKTLTSVRHVVDNVEPPTFCEVCKGIHGGGGKNHKN